MAVSKRKALRYSRDSKAFPAQWGKKRGRSGEKENEKERPYIISEGKVKSKLLGAWHLTQLTFFCLTWEDEETFNLRKTRGGGELKAFSGFC